MFLVLHRTEVLVSVQKESFEKRQEKYESTQICDMDIAVRLAFP
jgi:hypothetical protein